MSDSDRVYIFDTTLRDGEQSPGASMTREEKMQMAQQLEQLGVDILEAGFPIASEGEFEAVRAIAGVVKHATVAALARTTPEDITAGWEAIKDAADPRLHIFLATSDIHLKHKLKKTRDEVMHDAVEAIRLACSFTSNVEFSCEDATRSDLDYMCRVIEAVIDVGATVINVPDTVGYTMPREMAHIFDYIREHVPNIDQVILSTHCHNDLGLAVANTLTAVEHGVRQIECTINGIGERAGNASLEEVVMAMRTREDLMPYYTGIDSTKIKRSSDLLCQVTGLTLARNKPIVGRNAFAHEAGIHQHGVIADKLTYEIMTPETIGISRNELVLGKHSGKHGIRERLNVLGYDVDNAQLQTIYERAMALADKKKEVYDSDLHALMRDESTAGEDQTFRLESWKTQSGSGQAEATVTLRRNGDTLAETSGGDGPIDACFKAIERATGQSGTLLDYKVQSVSKGKDAMGEAYVTVQFGETVTVGHGTSTDVVEASIKAYINALNKSLSGHLVVDDEYHEGA